MRRRAVDASLPAERGAGVCVCVGGGGCVRMLRMDVCVCLEIGLES